MARTKNFDETTTLDRAVDIFRKQGYRATSPEELVSFLGISRSSLYSTYGDKKELFIKALDRYQKLTSKALNDIADSAEDGITGIRGIFAMTTDGVFDGDEPKGCLLVNSIVEFGPEDPRTVEILHESMKQNRETLIRLLKLGQQDGTVTKRTSPEHLADYLVNCLSGISVSAKGGSTRSSCELIAQSSLLLLLPSSN
ncbi:TetR/AcrR family transcriptional regulator [Pedobacter panaciterrae]|uniref:TetR/AcrR family transcriptional regulator n=1 Tax=Pedobacter panaciterrae TaxID=363849 RepID=UPI002596B684|nr:TetR/AcrR family transcriptional regulator [uncultured Pedobacter sp.]